MKLTPSLDRMPQSWQIILTLLGSLAVIWGFGWLMYDLSPVFLAVISGLSILVAIPFVVLDVWARRIEQRRKIEMIGKCPTCSYDLRAHHPGQKCPECGTPIPPPSPGT